MATATGMGRAWRPSTSINKAMSSISEEAVDAAIKHGKTAAKVTADLVTGGASKGLSRGASLLTGAAGGPLTGIFLDASEANAADEPELIKDWKPKK
jgi:fatty acid/phospholipid biosynthesis enzyme